MEIVVVGARGFGKYHLDALEKIDADVSIVESNPETVQYCQDHYSLKRVYDGFDSALSSDADIIDLVVPHSLHAPMAAKSMNSGKHVLVEKPIATSLEDARSMIRASEDAGLKFMVADQYFFDPAVSRMLDSIRRDEIGKVHTIIVRNQRLHNPPGWRGDRDLNGGGALIDGGIHYMNTFLNIGGSYDSIISRNYTGLRGSNVEDTTMAIFDFTSGAKGLLFYSWAYSAVTPLPSYEIIGDNGYIIEDLGSKPAEGFRGRRGMRVFGDPIVNNRLLQTGDYDVFEAEIQGFIDSIARDEPVPFSPELAVRDLEAVLRIYNNEN